MTTLEWGDKRPPSWSPEILISHHHLITIGPKNADIMGLLACLGAHLHHPRMNLAIPVFSSPWLCFHRELNQVSIHCSYQKNNRLMKVLCKRLSGAIAAVQYRALSNKYRRTQIKQYCIAVWQQSTQQSGFISQVSKGFPCYGDVLEFATPFYLKSSWDCSGELQETGSAENPETRQCKCTAGKRQSQGRLRCEHKRMSRDGRRLTE